MTVHHGLVTSHHATGSVASPKAKRARGGVAWRAACGCAATTYRDLRPGGYCASGACSTRRVASIARVVVGGLRPYFARRRRHVRQQDSPRVFPDPPARAPPLFPEYVLADGNRMGVDSCAPVGPTAASGPGFHVRWPPPGPRFSARSIPVSAGWCGPPADPVLPPLSMNFGFFFARILSGHLAWACADMCVRVLVRRKHL